MRPNRVTHTGLPHHNGKLTPTLAAIAAYRAWTYDSMFVPPPTLEQVRLLAEYCQACLVENFMDEYPHSFASCPELRQRLLLIKTVSDLADWLWDCRQRVRLEPL